METFTLISLVFIIVVLIMSIGFDGASFKGKCPRCDKPVLQDSTGAWF